MTSGLTKTTKMSSKTQHEVRWQMAEYPYENGSVIIELTHEENDRLVGILVDAREADLISDWDILPASPMTLDEFINVYGADFDVECPDV